MSEECPALTQRILRWLVRPFFDMLMADMVRVPEVEPDSEWARRADAMVKRREASIIPTSWFYASEFIWLVLTAPIWLTLIAIGHFRGWFRDER